MIEGKLWIRLSRLWSAPVLRSVDGIDPVSLVFAAPVGAGEKYLMKRVALTLALMIGSAALVYGGSYLIGYYRSTWSAMYSLAYAEGNDTAAHKYAERLSLLDKQQAGMYLAQLDVTRSLRLQGDRKSTRLNSSH